MIGYDTDITHTIRQLNTRILHPDQNQHLSSDCRGTLSSDIEDLGPANNDVLLGQPSTDPSSLFGNNTNPEINNLSKSSVMINQQDISYPSTVLDMTSENNTDFSLINNPTYRTD